jgi:hypothetical protein
MNRNIRILFGVVTPNDGACANDIGIKKTNLCASTVTRAEVVRSVQATYCCAAFSSPMSACFGQSLPVETSALKHQSNLYQSIIE